MTKKQKLLRILKEIIVNQIVSVRFTDDGEIDIFPNDKSLFNSFPIPINLSYYKKYHYSSRYLKLLEDIEGEPTTSLLHVTALDRIYSYLNTRQYVDKANEANHLHLLLESLLLLYFELKFPGIKKEEKRNQFSKDKGEPISYLFDTSFAEKKSNPDMIVENIHWNSIKLFRYFPSPKISSYPFTQKEEEQAKIDYYSEKFEHLIKRMKEDDNNPIHQLAWYILDEFIKKHPLHLPYTEHNHEFIEDTSKVLKALCQLYFSPEY